MPTGKVVASKQLDTISKIGVLLIGTETAARYGYDTPNYADLWLSQCEDVTFMFLVPGDRKVYRVHHLANVKAIQFKIGCFNVSKDDQPEYVAAVIDALMSAYSDVIERLRQDINVSFFPCRKSLNHDVIVSS